MLTIVIVQDNLHNKIQDTLNSIRKTRYFKQGKVQIVVYNPKKNVKKLSGIIYVDRSFEHIGALYNDALQTISTPYITFLKSGDIYKKSALDSALKQLNKMKDLDLVCLKLCKETHIIKRPIVTNIDLSKDYRFLNKSLGCYIMRKDVAKEIGFSETLEYFAEREFVSRLCSKIERFIFIDGTGLQPIDPVMGNVNEYVPAQKDEWYIEGLFAHLLPYIKEMKEKNAFSTYIQLNCYHLIIIMFNQNLNLHDKHVFKDGREKFNEGVKQVIDTIDDAVMAIDDELLFRVNPPLLVWLLKLKYGEDYAVHYTKDPVTHEVKLMFKDAVVHNVSKQKVKLDAINTEQEGLIVEASLLMYTEPETYRLVVRLDGQELPIEVTNRYAEVSYFGEHYTKWITTKIHIPFKMLTGSKKLLTYNVEVNNMVVTLRMVSGRFPARLNTKLPRCYAILNGYMVHFTKIKDGCASGIYICKNNWSRHIGHELSVFPAILIRSERITLTRIAYWITRPFLRHKKIWITYDKMYKGGDNGEYFYRYMLSQKGKNKIRPYYVINKNYPDAKRLKEEGLKPLYMNGLKHRLYFLNADVVATTHANIPVYSGCTIGGFALMRDLFHGHIVCIQHGLAIQDLPFDLNRVYDNLEGFYCASKNEIANLAKDYYEYDDKSMLHLTGVPRYDGLKNNDKKRILITPTWRRYIAMPANIGNMRPYSPTFKETDYFKIYNSLITDERLLKTARELGYEIRYVLHPTLSSQLKDYKQLEGVRVISSLDVNYEKEFVESSLMITDYSGVQFDFAYMRKPILYYHPPKLPPHYEEGGLNYETQGFGEICTEHEQLVDRLCEYMQNDCQMTEEYKQRVDDFFAFSDHNNCQRIYDDLMKQFY